MADRYTPEQRRDYTNKYRDRRKQFALDRLGRRCSACGSTDDLQFDHIDRTTKVLPIGKMWTSAWEKFVEELAKCQLLCHPCHIEKTVRNREFRDYSRG